MDPGSQLAMKRDGLAVVLATIVLGLR